MTRTPTAEAGGADWVSVPLLGAIFAGTGFSALTLQVTWQRVISLHSGVDLASLTIVVAAFLAGLGLGNLLAGWAADRLGPRRSLVAFALSNAGIGVFAVFSVWLFYDVYRRFAADLSGSGRSFAFNAALVVVPTVLMGLSLPLLARVVVQHRADAGTVLGRLYAANTIGAAAGAMAAGWLLLGNLGFVTTVRLAGMLNIAAAVAVLALARRAPTGTTEHPLASGNLADPSAPAASVATERVWPWIAAYALTGAVALGLEQVFFRLVDTIMRSNSYSFGHVLGLYLALFAAGAAVASRRVASTDDPKRVFCLLQLGVGVGAVAPVVVLARVVPALGLDGPLRDYFGTDGFNVGFSAIDSARGAAAFAFAYLIAPILIMGLPVFLAGASYPFIQAIVTDRSDAVGRRTGILLAANVGGNVAGTLLTGFLLIDRLGTAGTLRLLSALLGAAGAAALAIARHAGHVRTLRLAVGGLGSLGLLVAAMPSNNSLWAFFHGTDETRLTVAEKRSCATTLKRNDAGEEILHINASSQNGYPFDDFHVLIGLLPALAHADPQRALAIGLGIGATAYGMASVADVGQVDVVELCDGQYDLLEGLAAGGAPELQRLFADQRVHRHVADGRKFLLLAEEDFDVITVDTLRPQSAFSGSLYSTDFYQLLADRLAPGGMVAQWVPTARALNSITSVFPHVVSVAVASYNGSPFVLASMDPIELDPQRLAAEFAAIDPSAYSPTQAGDLGAFLGAVDGRCEANGLPPQPRPDWSINRDLAPRDEYFLNNDLGVASLAGCG